MNPAHRRNDKIRRAYRITNIEHTRNFNGAHGWRAEYRISFEDSDPITVDVPLCGHTQTTIMTAIVLQMNDRPVIYRP